MDTLDQHRSSLIREALCLPADVVGYRISEQLAGLLSEKGILEGAVCGFDVMAYAAGGMCTLAPRSGVHEQIDVGWLGPGAGLARHAVNAWFDVVWQGHPIEVLLATWTQGINPAQHFWIVAESREIAEQFYLAVCEWCAEVRGEVLVFDGGRWQKSEALFRAIQDATFENLVLQGSLKEEIRADLDRFFASRPLYQEYGVPWKRGILFIGPPGNGKTHTVKALINAMSQPCLYVKSFQSEYATDNDSIRTVFQRARQTTPCVLVLEDLDSLLHAQNRSFFLNELDGFAANEGIVTLATTNHPERLDPAILDRPSRFDRKYHFELPGPDERRAYIELWNRSLKPALRLRECGIARIVELTEEFSFAYIKELFLSTTMRWIASPEPGGMEEAMVTQCAALREQMSSMNEEPLPEFEPNADPAAIQMAQAMMRRRLRGRRA